MRNQARILIFLFLLDFAGLSLATWWLCFAAAATMSPTGLLAPVIPPVPPATLAVVQDDTRLAVVQAAPTAVSRQGDSSLMASPQYVLCGTTDLQHNAWVGTQEQGVYEFLDGNWRPFTTDQGLGENNVSALACDCLGRIWAGHISRGVSVYNGKQWKNIDRLSGLGGSRVFCIETCPTDGDVWIATEAGFTRYCLKSDTWKYYDQAAGLPSNDADCLAFDSRGNIYVGLQSNGIDIAHADDDYAHWTHCPGPSDRLTQASGSGLPSCLINAMLVTRDDTVYAGTCRGLACSIDHGASWSYLQGKDWELLAKGAYGSIPDDADLTAVNSPLAEDWITCLMQDPTGMIWIGYQNKGYQAFVPSAAQADRSVPGKFVKAIIPIADGRCLIGTFGKGVYKCGVQYTGPRSAKRPTPTSALAADAFPAQPPVADIAALDAMRQKLDSLPTAPDGAEFLADDWETGGDWIGRYGSRTADFLGYNPSFHTEPAYQVALGTGPYQQAYMRYYWDDKPDVEPTRLLWDPIKKRRLYCENNDESYERAAHPRTAQGPDLFVRVTVPAGAHVVSLFFQNSDAKGNEQRDFFLQLKKTDSDDQDDPEGSYRSEHGYSQIQPSDTTDAELAPALASSRVFTFHEGVYKRVLIRGAGTYWIKIGRNLSWCTKVSAVFIDRLDPMPGNPPDWFGPAYTIAATDYSSDPGPKGAAWRLWAQIDQSSAKAGYAGLMNRARLMAYRAGAAAGMDDQTLSNWRQKMLSWTEPDREQFDDAAGIAPAQGL